MGFSNVQKIRYEEYLKKKERKVTILGITNWNTIKGKNKLLCYTNPEKKLANYNPYELETSDDVRGEKSLDPFHTHFLLCDSGDPMKEYKKTQAGQIYLDDGKKVIRNERENVYREEFEVFANHDEIPVIRIVIGSDKDKLFAVKSAVVNKIPCLFVKVIL